MSTPTASRLAVALVDDRLAGVAGKRIAITLTASARADVVMRITKGGRTVATLRASATTGRASVRWLTKVKGKALAAGRYAINVRAVGADAQVATARGVVVLTRS